MRCDYFMIAAVTTAIAAAVIDLWLMQGQPVGQYNPPPEIQPKTKQQKKRAEMTVPETQVVASGRLASASEAESGQLATGEFLHIIMYTLYCYVQGCTDPCNVAAT